MRARWLGSLGLLVGSPLLAAEGPASPLALTAISADDLSLRGDPWELAPAARVPGMLRISLPGTGVTARSLRGLADSGSIAPLDPALGVFVDGVPLGRIDGEAFALFDLDQAAVRRGGQGALLGRGTSAGALDLKLAAPADTFGGYVGGAWGAWDRKMVRGSVNVPLGAVGLKVSAYISDDDGVVRNRVTDEKLNDEDRAGIRLAARLAPAEQIEWTAAVAYVQDKGENILSFGCNPADPTACRGWSSTTGMVKSRILGGGPQYSLPVSGDKADQVLGRVEATTLLTSRLAWTGDMLEVALISGFVDTTETSGLDFGDGRGLPSAVLPDPPVRGFTNGGYAVLTDGSSQQMSQELRVSGRLLDGALGWTVGGQLLDGNDRLDAADMQTLEDGTAAGQPRLLADRIVRTSNRALAGFADVNFTTGALRLEAGVRYTDEERRLTSLSQAACGPAGCLSLASVPGKLTAGVWTPRAAASFEVLEGVSLFASASRGYRPGGWNVRAVSPAAFASYAPETAWTYEGGVAGSALGGRLSARVTGFLLDVSDMQGSGGAVIDGVPQFWAGTLADFRNQGVELELAAQPVDALHLYANLTAQNPRYRRTAAVDAQIALCAGGTGPTTACGVGAVTSDGDLAEPAFAPDLTAGFGARYDLPIPSAGIILSPGVDFSWRSRFQTDTANLGASAPAHLLMDAAVAIETDDKAWLLTLSCRNCLDEDAGEASLLGWTYPVTPRSWMLVARRTF